MFPLYSRPAYTKSMIIVEELIPTIKEMFPNAINVISQNNFILIRSDFPMRGKKKQSTMSHISRANGFPLCHLSTVSCSIYNIAENKKHTYKSRNVCISAG